MSGAATYSYHLYQVGNDSDVLISRATKPFERKTTACNNHTADRMFWLPLTSVYFLYRPVSVAAVMDIVMVDSLACCCWQVANG